MHRPASHPLSRHAHPSCLSCSVALVETILSLSSWPSISNRLSRPTQTPCSQMTDVAMAHVAHGNPQQPWSACGRDSLTPRHRPAPGSISHSTRLPGDFMAYRVQRCHLPRSHSGQNPDRCHRVEDATGCLLGQTSGSVHEYSAIGLEAGFARCQHSRSAQSFQRCSHYAPACQQTDATIIQAEEQPHI